jgi:hypothetical protein
MRQIDSYDIIIKNNLFLPLGHSDVKQESLALVGTVGKSAFIQEANKSFYVTEGESFGNNVRLISVGVNNVTIEQNGDRRNLLLQGM